MLAVGTAISQCPPGASRIGLSSTERLFAASKYTSSTSTVGIDSGFSTRTE